MYYLVNNSLHTTCHSLHFLPCLFSMIYKRPKGPAGTPDSNIGNVGTHKFIASSGQLTRRRDHAAGCFFASGRTGSHELSSCSSC